MRRMIFAIVSLVLLPFAALAQSYAIQPGDVLSIEVAEDNTLNRQVLVLPDGSISFPFAGSLRASGLSTGTLAARLSSAMAADFAAPPTLYVSVSRLRPEGDKDTMNIYLMGEVMSPGLKEIPPGATLLQALSTGGGFTKFAATKRLQLRRADPQGGREYVFKFNYKAMSQGAAMANSVFLREGDVILVPERSLFE